MRYFIIAGEASGDLHASRLMLALRREDPEASFCFMGGEQMAKAIGIEPVVHYRDVAVMGWLSVLKSWRHIHRAAKVVQQAIAHFQPDVVIPVDFGSFSMRYVLPYAKSLGIKVAYYILPKLWASRPGRIKKLRRYVDRGLVILPFEEAYFRERGLETLYVGNPSWEEVRAAGFLEVHHADRLGGEITISLLPGSRRQEVEGNLRVMLEAVALAYPKAKVLIAGVSSLGEPFYRELLSNRTPDSYALVFDKTLEMVSKSHFALVTSGTATLEVALVGTPEVVCYRIGGQRFARWIFDHLISAKYFSLVNLILDKPAVPELIGHEVSPQRIAREMKQILEQPERMEALKKDYETLSSLLAKEDASREAARAIVRLAGTV